jgi:tetratricopeptide (TPR) repeat protein
MLYRVITLSGIDEVRVALEKLLDEITPYYQAKTQSLPPQQRKILDFLARMASESRDAPTPGQIAAATRLSPNQLSAQLKHLVGHGYIVPADRLGRNTYYRLSEPLYSVWYQMRFGRGARRRIEWLVAFLRLWYTPEQFHQEGMSLGSRFETMFHGGRVAEARTILESCRALAAAAKLIPGAAAGWSWVASGSADLESTPSGGTDWSKAQRWIERGDSQFIRGRRQEAVDCFEHALELQPDLQDVWFRKASALDILGHFEEALASYDRSLQIRPEQPQAWANKASVLEKLGRYDEALTSHDQALKVQSNDASIWTSKGLTLHHLGRYEEALSMHDRALELRPDYIGAWLNRAAALERLDRHDEAVTSYKHASGVEPQGAAEWLSKAFVLRYLARYDEASPAFERALQLLRLLHADPSTVSWASAFALATRIVIGELDEIQRDWQALIDLGETLDELERQAVLFVPLGEAIKQGQFELAHELAVESKLEDSYFPLVRALDYATTGDRALIDKLPPELRSLVEEIVASLPDIKPKKPGKAGSPKAKKRKKRSSSRTRKKLS